MKISGLSSFGRGDVVALMRAYGVDTTDTDIDYVLSRLQSGYPVSRLLALIQTFLTT